MRLAPLVLVLTSVAASGSEVAAQRRLGNYVRRAFDYRAVEAGLVGGPNRTTLTGAGPVNPSVRGMLGGFVSVRLGDGFRLRPEVLVSGKQSGVTTELLPPCAPPGACAAIIQRENTSLTWLEAPLLLEYRPDGFGRDFAPRLFAGPFLALRVGCSQSVRTSNDPNNIHLVRTCGDQTPQSPQFNNGDGGFVLGGGLYRRGVGVGLRWTRSLAEVAPFQSGNFSTLFGAKQSTLTATLEFATRLW
ncbi:MAG: outer membrane beta-barrel protein [Gemmatimonadales bacterium]